MFDRQAQRAILGVGTAALLAVTAAACGNGGSPTAAGAAPAPGSVTPDGVNFGLSQLDALVRADQKATTIPGVAVAVVYGGKVRYAKGFGVRRVGSPAAVDANTVFQLASVSKPITSTVLSAAVTQQKISWDQPVQQGLPGFTLRDPYIGSHVTLADMYSHRSGLPDHAGDILEDLGFSQPAIFNKLRREPLGPYRLQYDYTNYGLSAAGESAAATVGKSFEQLAQEELFQPLGMTSTSTTFAALAGRSDRADLHTKVNGQWKPDATWDVDRQAPAGGVSSSVNDLAKWVTMLLAGGKYNGTQLVAPAELQRMWQPQSIRQPAAHIGDLTGFYGLGWNIDYGPNNQLIVQHSGAFAHGAATNVLLVPAAGLGIISLTNGFPVGLPESINRQFLDDVEFGHQTQDWLTLFRNAFAGLEELNHEFDTPPPVVVPSRPLADYIGTFTNAYWGTLKVQLTGGKLAFTIGPDAMRFGLTHYTGDRFYFVTRGESASGQSGAIFAGPPGPAAKLTIVAWDKNALGTFIRSS